MDPQMGPLMGGLGRRNSIPESPFERSRGCVPLCSDGKFSDKWELSLTGVCTTTRRLSGGDAS
jgi:hypothetical protein